MHLLIQWSNSSFNINYQQFCSKKTSIQAISKDFANKIQKFNEKYSFSMRFYIFNASSNLSIAKICKYLNRKKLDEF